MNEHRDHNAPCIPLKILHNHCFQFLLVLQSSQDKSKAMIMQNFGGQPGELWSAYHLFGKPGNFGENSTGTVQPSENCPEKK